MQTVYLGADTTSFAVPCEGCLSLEEGSLAARRRAASIQSSLRMDVDVGFRTCRRGHRLLVKRLPAVYFARRELVT